MSDKLTEQDLDLLVYVVDVWLQSNENHPAWEKVDKLSDKLSNCSSVKIIG